jgi:putative ATPase
VDLFGSESLRPPLAERMRPRTLDEFVGQEKLVGPGRPLRDAIERGAPRRNCGRSSSDR